MIHHVTRATKHLIFWSLVLAAISLTGIRLALIGVESYKSNLENRISLLAGTPVKLGSLGANMRGISPELVLKDIHIDTILQTEKPTLQLKAVHLRVNLGNFLFNQDILSSSWVTVVGAKLTVYRKPDGEIAIEGLKSGKSQPLWLLQGRQYEVLQSEITWHDRQKGMAPLVLEDFNLAVINSGKHHRINVTSKLPLQYGNNLKIISDFEGSVDKLSEIKGKLFFAGNKLKLSELATAYLPFEISMTDGFADIKAWADWEQSTLVSVKTEAKLDQTLFARKGKGNFSISHLDAQINWQTKGNSWWMDINRFLLDSEGIGNKATKKWPDAIVSLVGKKAGDPDSSSLAFYAKQVDLAEATMLARFFAPISDEQDRLLGQAQLSGLIRDFSVYSKPIQKSFAVAGWFDSVSLEPILSVPGLANVSGVIQGSEKTGKIQLASQDALYKAAQLFNKPLKFNQLKGLLSWQQTEEQWIVRSPEIEIACLAFQSVSRFEAQFPKSGEKPFLDLQTAFASKDISQAVANMPTAIMKDKLKTWLTNAFVGGKIPSGNLLIYGKSSDFPYVDDSGVFEVSLDVENAGLNYHPEWPKISEIKGRVTMTKDKITGVFSQGKIGKNAINKTEMFISGLGTDPLLSIKSEGEGEVNQALKVLLQSPLNTRVDPFISGVTLQGMTTVNLELAIPLLPGHEIKVDGKAKMNNAQLIVNRLGLKVETITGDLKFNKQGVFAENIQANALGKSIKANITQEEEHTLVDINGRANVNEIKRLFALSPNTLAEGESDYLLQLQIPKLDLENNPIAITVKSTLEGISLNLPGSLAKAKAQQKPTELKVSLRPEQAMPFELDYNNELKAAISYNARDHKINSGHVLIGSGSVKQTKMPGIKVEVSREHLPLQEWLGMSATMQPSDRQDMRINQIKIHSQSAFWNKTRLGNFDLTLNRTPEFWSGEIESALAKGRFQLPITTTGVKPVNLDMEMLNFSALRQIKTLESSAASDFKPLLNINCKKALWNSENLGQLTLETERTAKGMNIKRLELKGDDETLALTGNWREAGIKSITRLNGKLEMKKADELFDKLNITKDLTGTSGTIDFKLNWNAAPWQLSLPSLRGTMDISLKDGRILSVEPGFGRVLGILAIAQWIKRLQLDFSDIYAEGLTFDSIKGHFDLANGKATTQALVIDAVPAKITIVGETNLVNQSIDQVIKVVPKSLDAVPIAGTIVSRIAAMVGKTLTGKDQEGFFFGTQYRVNGSWDDIQISSLHENDGLIQKTWKSITNFPWDEE